MAFAAGYAIVVGLLMLIVWALLLITGQVPNLESELLALVFHWAAELLTAIALIVAGLALGRRKRGAAWGYPLALGLLIYSLINSPGFYAQAQEWAMVGMFAALLALALVALALFVRGWAQER